MHCLIQTEAIVDLIVKPVLSNIGFIVWMAKSVGRILDRAVNEYCF